MDRKGGNPIIATIMIVLVIAVTVTAIYAIYTTSKRPHQPQAWINLDEVYGLGYINKNEYSIHLPGTDYTILKTDPTTHSMLPTIPDHSAVILTTKFNISNLKVGDIIVYRADGMNICHRIVEVGHDEKGIFFKTKGDNNYYTDSYTIREKDILGVVVGVIW